MLLNFCNNSFVKKSYDYFFRHQIKEPMEEVLNDTFQSKLELSLGPNQYPFNLSPGAACRPQARTRHQGE